jgi:hypothetical protein
MAGTARHASPPEPETESQRELAAWLQGPPRRSQVLLALACNLSQPTLSQYVARRARPSPDSEAAILLELATGGRVSRLGWLTPEEHEDRRQRRINAARFARAIESGKHLVVTMKVASSDREPPRGRRPRGTGSNLHARLAARPGVDGSRDANREAGAPEDG